MDLENSHKIERPSSDKQSANVTGFGKKIAVLVKRSEQLNPLPITADSFNNRLIDKVLDDVCKLKPNTQSL
jgi:hypothetical protein